MNRMDDDQNNRLNWIASASENGRTIADRAVRRRGVVLVVVLVVVMLLALAGFGFLAGMSTEYEAAKLHGSMRQARQTMASAESTILWLVSLPDDHRRTMGGLHHNPSLFRSQVVDTLQMAGSTGNTDRGIAVSSQQTGRENLRPTEAPAGSQVDDRWRFSVVSVETQDQTQVLRFGLKNESSRLNLTRLLLWEQRSPGAGRTALMQLPGMTETVADCLLDWIDADDTPREFGAESEYYNTLDRPYNPSNKVPQSLMELLYVKGVTRSMLLGTSQPGDIGMSNSLPDEMSSAMSSGDTFASADGTGLQLSVSSSGVFGQSGWQQFLTVYSAERNHNRNGAARIYLNSGSLATLEQQLESVLPPEIVRYILLARVYGLQPTPAQGVEPAAAPFTVSMSPASVIVSPADLIDSSIQVPSASGTIVVRSPLLSDDPSLDEKFAAFIDVATTELEQVVYGRINIFEASETVLRMIPGMTHELVSQLISQRESLKTSDASLEASRGSSSLTWLLTQNLLDVVTFRRVFPELTTSGDVFQAEIIVHRAIGGPLLRRNLILDAAAFPSRRLHWTDLTDSPMTYPAELLLPRQ